MHLASLYLRQPCTDAVFDAASAVVRVPPGPTPGPDVSLVVRLKCISSKGEVSPPFSVAEAVKIEPCQVNKRTILSV